MRHVLFAASLLLLLGCQGPATTPAGGGGGGGTPGVLPLRALGEGTFSRLTSPLAAAYRDEAGYARFWEDLAPGAVRPPVDFAAETVVAVVRQRDTGGYTVAFVDAVRDGDRLTVSWRESRPPADAITIQILTQPWAVAAVPRHDGPVDFREVPAP